MASSQDAWYISLLGLAEHFRISTPPNIRSCIQCLQAVFYFKPPPRVEARTHLQLGNILLNHTKNIDLARTHLEQSWMLSQSINGFDDVKFEAASVLAELHEAQGQPTLSKPVLRKAIELSQHSLYWHCRLIFQLAQVHAVEKEYEVACSLLGVGADYAHLSNAPYARGLCLLSRAMLLLTERKQPDLLAVLHQAGHLVDTCQAKPSHRDYLKVFFLVLQVSHYLSSGQVKSVKPSLKQLQQSIQSLMAEGRGDEEETGAPGGDSFVWLGRNQLYVLVYLLTVMHSTQAGYMDKAHKYADKAVGVLDREWAEGDKNDLSWRLRVVLCEQVGLCRLIAGGKAAALAEIARAARLVGGAPSARLQRLHAPPLHALLGLYAMSMNCMEAAERQLQRAAQLASAAPALPPGAQPPGAHLACAAPHPLATFAKLNLCIVLARTRREAELAGVLESVRPEALPAHAHAAKAAAYYVLGLHAFFHARYNEAKRYLRETLKMANAEDLNRLTSCSLVLLGHIFLSVNNSRESMNMVTPAMQLASKIPDVHVQLWASAILKDLHRLRGEADRERDAYNMHCAFSQALLNDHFHASQLPHHALLTWLEGAPPALPPPPPPPAPTAPSLPPVPEPILPI